MHHPDRVKSDAPSGHTNITHLVLSGGGPSGFCLLGAMMALAQDGHWSVRNLRGVYGTSIGAALGAMLLLCDDWATLHAYLVDRPWEQALSVSPRQWLDCFERKGLFDARAVELVFQPLLAARHLPLDLTLAQLHEATGTDLHVFTFNLNRFQTVDVSHRTHPHLRLTQAVAMSAALPGVMAPVFSDSDLDLEDLGASVEGDREEDGGEQTQQTQQTHTGGCFIDGGVLCNFPMDACLRTPGVRADQVLGITCGELAWRTVGRDSTLLDLAVALASNTMRHLRGLQSPEARRTLGSEREEEGEPETNQGPPWKEGEPWVITVSSCAEPWTDVLCQRETRRKLVEQGMRDARDQAPHQQTT